MKKSKKIEIGVVLFIVLFFALFRIYGRPHIYRVSEGGMLPTYMPTNIKSHLFDIVTIGLNKNVCAGCVVVYKHNNDSNIARIIALPNDVITIQKRNKSIAVNGVTEIYKDAGISAPLHDNDGKLFERRPQFTVTEGGVTHMILMYDTPSIANFKNGLIKGNNDSQDLSQEFCVDGPDEMTCTAKGNSVFVIGDNRGNSLYGLVAIDDIVGIHNPNN